MSPVPICSTRELTGSGAFWTLDVAGIPVLVVRDAHGTIRAFENVCRHRGVRLVHERHGVTRSFVCLLHGWTYDAEGQMGGAIVARLAQDDPMLSALRENNALTRLPLALRHGLAWVAPHPRSPLDVAGLLGPVDAELMARGVESYGVREHGTAVLGSDLVAVVRPGLLDEDIFHLVSDDLAVVLHAEDVSIFVRGRQRAETGSGEASTAAFESSSIEHMRLGPSA